MAQMCGIGREKDAVGRWCRGCKKRASPYMISTPPFPCLQALTPQPRIDCPYAQSERVVVRVLGEVGMEIGYQIRDRRSASRVGCL